MPWNKLDLFRGDSRFGLTIDFGWPGVKPQVEYVKAALKKVGIDVEVRASADFPTATKSALPRRLLRKNLLRKQVSTTL